MSKPVSVQQSKSSSKLVFLPSGEEGMWGLLVSSASVSLLICKMPRIRKPLSISEKYAIIKDVESKRKTQTEICKEKGIPPSTVNTILKKSRDKIISDYESENGNPERKRVRGSDFPEVDEALLMWLQNARAANMTVHGPDLLFKANEFTRNFADLGMEKYKKADFRLGYVDKFKKRHLIGNRLVTGESAAVNQETVAEWQATKLGEIRKKYATVDIFNADETGFFYKLLPNQTLAFKHEKCKGGKLSKERITVLVGASMEGKFAHLFTNF